MNLLFICNQGQHRSRTAAEIYGHKFSTRHAGLYSDEPITARQFDWADIVIVMEDHQRTELSRRFPKAYLKKRILSLNIPDIYQYRQPELVKILNERMTELAEPLIELEQGAPL